MEVGRGFGSALLSSPVRRVLEEARHMDEFPKFLLANPDNVEDYRIVADAAEEAEAGKDGYWFGGKPKKATKAG